MSNAIDSTSTGHLSVVQLRALANSPDETLTQLVAVLHQLASDDEETIQWASESLENCGAPRPEHLTALSEGLRSSSPLVATWSCKLLARMGTEAQGAQSQLAYALASNENMLVREEAARAIGLVGPISPAARATLEKAASEGSPRLKRLATAALGG